MRRIFLVTICGIILSSFLLCCTTTFAAQRFDYWWPWLYRYVSYAKTNAIPTDSFVTVSQDAHNIWISFDTNVVFEGSNSWVWIQENSNHVFYVVNRSNFWDSCILSNSAIYYIDVQDQAYSNSISGMITAATNQNAINITNDTWYVKATGNQSLIANPSAALFELYDGLGTIVLSFVGPGAYTSMELGEGNDADGTSFVIGRLLTGRVHSYGFGSYGIVSNFSFFGGIGGTVLDGSVGIGYQPNARTGVVAIGYYPEAIGQDNMAIGYLPKVNSGNPGLTNTWQFGRGNNTTQNTLQFTRWQFFDLAGGNIFRDRMTNVFESGIHNICITNHIYLSADDTNSWIQGLHAGNGIVTDILFRVSGTNYLASGI